MNLPIFKGIDSNSYLHQGTLVNNEKYYIVYRNDNSQPLAQFCANKIQEVGNSDVFTFINTKIKGVIIFPLIADEYLIGYFKNGNTHFIFFQKNGHNIEDKKDWIYGGFPTNTIYEDPKNESFSMKPQILESITII